MYSEVKKLHLIEELLKVKDDSILEEIERTLSSAHTSAKKKSFTEFAGKISAEDLDKMEKDIKEHCGQIIEDDWK